VQLHLHESFTALVTEGLGERHLDAGILRDGDPFEGLQVTTILSEPFVAVIRQLSCARQRPSRSLRCATIHSRAIRNLSESSTMGRDLGPREFDVAHRTSIPEAVGKTTPRRRARTTPRDRNSLTAGRRRKVVASETPPAQFAGETMFLAQRRGFS